tara:strand:- start:4 stop:219 length:216 start_codon:yes stop_codon:yes gene_type:complete
MKKEQSIRPENLTFKKTSGRSFTAHFEGVQLYHAFIEKGKINYIDNNGIWDRITRTPLKWFERMPNFNLEF